MTGHVLYWFAGVMAIWGWWPSPMASLLLLGVVQDGVAFRWGRGSILAGMRAGMVGVEYLTAVMLLGSAAGDRIDEMVLAGVMTVYGVIRGFLSVYVYTPGLDLDRSVGHLVRNQLAAFAEFSILASLFILWRGDWVDGVGLGLYGLAAALQALLYAHRADRRMVARVRILLLAALGVGIRMGWV